jgi:hypothetical protein
MARRIKRRSFCGTALLWLAVTCFIAAQSAVASAAEGQAPSPAAAAPSIPPQPAPADKPGFLRQLKAWWNSSIGFFDKGIKDTSGTFTDFGKKSGDTAKEAAHGAATVTEDAMKKTLDVGKDAATTITRLPNTRVLEMHATCAKAPNGAPDCAAAAASACRDRGFSGGKPLDVRTAEKCDTTPAWRAGQSPGKGECPIESWITSAVCQ